MCWYSAKETYYYYWSWNLLWWCHPNRPVATSRAQLKRNCKSGNMDSSVVYFIDPMYDPGQQSEIYRKNNTGDRIAYRVSMLISLYNKYTHGVDVFDQIRRLFGIDLVHPSKNTLWGYLKYFSRWYWGKLTISIVTFMQIHLVSGAIRSSKLMS